MPPRFVMPPLHRIEPRLGPEHFVSYTRAMPLSSHWRVATCEEVECEDFVHGFVFTCNTSTPLGEKQYHYLVNDKSRKYSLQRVSLNEFKFVYPPGTRGFAGAKHEHRLPIGREPLWLVRGGDWRGNPRQRPVVKHASAEDWVEDCSENQGKIKDIAKKG